MRRNRQSAQSFEALCVAFVVATTIPSQAAKPVPSAAPEPAIPAIYLNQSGFNLGKPKRFTAPTLADGTRFEVRESGAKSPAFNGTLRGNIGDLTEFNPRSDKEFTITAGGITSVPFRIGPNWLERVTWQRALDFMIDSRHYVGNYRNTCPGSFGWRDDHHFGFELHVLVPQYLANPSAYERMERQVKYEAPKNPKLWGALEPYREDAPDIVKLMHWGADVIVTQNLRHELLKSQLAYFLHAWPAIERWLPEQNRKVVEEYAFRVWQNPDADRKYPYDESKGHDLLACKTRIGSTKGCLPPGFSVEPNLLMHEAAKRSGRADADRYLAAAVTQAKWLVENLDWNNPLSTKGQRQGEFLTITGLAHLLRNYPDRAPKELPAKLAAWAGVAVRRSNNMWDFRKLDDGDRWTPMDPSSPQKWNEPGNVCGFPAPLLACREFVTDSATRARLDQLVWSHFDNMFGRNPVGRHFSFDGPREIEGVEFGWFRDLPGGIGKLSGARFVLDGSPKDGHYPYHPEKGDFGWTEGWVQFNVAYNISLAYLAWSETKVEAVRNGGDLVVRLTAPLNFAYDKVETATVLVTTASGDTERVKVTEESPCGATFIGRIPLTPANTPARDNGSLEAKSGEKVVVSYGYGYLARQITLSL